MDHHQPSLKGRNRGRNGTNPPTHAAEPHSDRPSADPGHDTTTTRPATTLDRARQARFAQQAPRPVTVIIRAPYPRVLAEIADCHQTAGARGEGIIGLRRWEGECVDEALRRLGAA